MGNTATRTKSARLHDVVAAVCPIVGISVGTIGDSATVTIAPADGATPAQLAQGQAVIDRFDWSDAADDTFADSKEPQLASLRDQVATAIGDIDTYLAASSTATPIQVRAEVAAIDQRQKQILQVLVRVAIKLLGE